MPKFVIHFFIHLSVFELTIPLSLEGICLISIHICFKYLKIVKQYSPIWSQLKWWKNWVCSSISTSIVIHLIIEKIYLASVKRWFQTSKQLKFHWNLHLNYWNQIKVFINPFIFTWSFHEKSGVMFSLTRSTVRVIGWIVASIVMEGIWWTHCLTFKPIFTWCSMWPVKKTSGVNKFAFTGQNNTNHTFK